MLYDEEEKDKVTGVVLSDDTTLTADLVVLATGAWTAKLIDLRGRTLSTGQALAYMQITDEEQERLYNMPTVLNFATGMFIIPTGQPTQNRPPRLRLPQPGDSLRTRT